MLVQMGAINNSQLKNVLSEQKKTGEKLDKILINKGFLTKQQLVEALGFLLGIPYVKLSKLQIDPEAVKLVPQELIRLHKALPISIRNNSITIAIADPLNQQAVDDISMATGMNAVPVLVSEKDLETAIRQHLTFRLDPKVEKIFAELKKEEIRKIEEPLRPVRVEDEAPIIRMVNSIITQAVQGRCSDIHIEPQEHNMRVRFRLDGELYEVMEIPKTLSPVITSRLKIMASMDITEKRIPQDGRFRINIEGHEIDLRASTLPTHYGEKIVLRILDGSYALTRIDELGFNAENRDLLVSLAQSPHGMIIATGPTGSGKTTTLYSIIAEINSADVNIITIEDPIEYAIPGINQVQIQPKAGLTFASGLRSILRQDPDVIMVGEIRDRETARLAVQAALTGHLVLSTMHTNSAAGAIARIIDMGVENFLIASSLRGVISQRLVRQLCPNCCETFVLDDKTAAKLNIPQESGNEFFRAKGCSMCRQLGYNGRLALQEIMAVSHDIRDLINRGNVSENLIEETAVNSGMKTLKIDGLEKAKKGLTSLEEVMKAVLLGG
ncbi:MAG: type II/IV secretion system protein [Syntrophomonadaceae bacterium]|nr:type II/IV secretion system protein [Syntrophomonadaceae bacterium]